MQNDMKKTKNNRARLLLILFIAMLTIAGSCKKDKLEAVKIPLRVDSYYPNSGNAGTLIRIQGTGFDPVLKNNSVAFGGVNGSVLRAETETLVIQVPEGGKTGMITIKSGNQSLDIGLYTYQTLTVQRVEPANGPAGSQISIYGQGFGSLTQPARVNINGKNAIIASASDTLLVAEVPEAAGNGPVEVFVDGKSAKGQNFTFQDILSVKPLSGGKGTRVRINGLGFDPIVEKNKVDFNGKPAKILEASPGTLLVEVPEGAVTGRLSITVNGQRSAGPVFTLVPAPELQEVSPLSGPEGVEMTIKGDYFSEVTDENQVSINGTIIPLSFISDKVLKLNIPAGVGSGTLKVVVNDQETVGPKFHSQQLSIMDLSPDNGLAGTEVTLSGSGFKSSLSENRVSFNGIQAEVLSATENSLIVKAPVSVQTGKIKVAVSGLEAESSRDFRRAGVSTIAEEIPVLHSMTIDPQGNIFAITDSQIIKITPQGQKSTIAEGFSFNYTSGIVRDNQQNLYVSQPERGIVSKITPAGTTSVFASIGAAGKMVIAANNAITVASTQVGMVRISSAGQTTAIKPVSRLAIVNPEVQFAMDNAGGVYYLPAYYESQNIAYNPITSPDTYYWVGGAGFGGDDIDGIGGNASFASVGNIISYGPNNLLVTGFSINLRQVNRLTREATTLIRFQRGYEDGTLREAKVRAMNHTAIGPEQSIYFYDNNSIRKIFFR
jgi:hypothetical protein